MSRLPRVVPRGCFLSTGASPAYGEAGNPKARAAGKEAVRAGVAEEEERWQPAGLGTARRAGAELPPLASIPRPRSQTPPLVPSVLQSMAWPRGHLDAGSGSRSPTPTLPPRPCGPRAESTCLLSAMPPFPLPALRPLLERSRLLAKCLPPGHVPSDGRLSPLRRIQETFISVSLYSPPSPLFFFS